MQSVSVKTIPLTHGHIVYIFIVFGCHQQKLNSLPLSGPLPAGFSGLHLACLDWCNSPLLCPSVSDPEGLVTFCSQPRSPDESEALGDADHICHLFRAVVNTVMTLPHRAWTPSWFSCRGTGKVRDFLTQVDPGSGATKQEMFHADARQLIGATLNRSGRLLSDWRARCLC